MYNQFMIFTPERVEFETSEHWFTSKFGFGVAYEDLLDVAAHLQEQLHEFVGREVTEFDDEVYAGATIDEAMYRASRAVPETRFLVERLSLVSKVLLGGPTPKFYLCHEEQA